MIVLNPVPPAVNLITSADVIQAVPRLSGYADLADLITDVSAEVVAYCGQNFGANTYTETHDGQNLPRLWLRNLPIVSVTSVTIEGNAVDDTNGDGWTFNASTGELRRGNGQQNERFEAWFPEGMQNVVVVYTAGTTVPRQVRRACILTVKHWVDQTKYTGVFKKEEIGDYKYELADNPVMLPMTAQRLLDAFVLDRFA